MTKRRTPHQYIEEWLLVNAGMKGHTACCRHCEFKIDVAASREYTAAVNKRWEEVRQAMRDHLDTEHPL